MEAQSRTRRSLVIGMGNPLSGDDAFGPRVIQRLRYGPAESLQHADLVDAHTDLLDLIELFPHYERVVMVDVVLDPESRFAGLGQVVILEEVSLQGLSETSPGVHQVSPLLAVKLFRRLHPQARTRISLVALCTDRILMGSGTEVSPGYLTDDAVDKGAERVCQSI